MFCCLIVFKIRSLLKWLIDWLIECLVPADPPLGYHHRPVEMIDWLIDCVVPADPPLGNYHRPVEMIDWLIDCLVPADPPLGYALRPVDAALNITLRAKQHLDVIYRQEEIYYWVFKNTNPFGYLVFAEWFLYSFICSVQTWLNKIIKKRLKKVPIAI